MQMATKRTLSLSALQQILAYLFDDRPHKLAKPFAHWLTTSKPFALFAQTYQQKIRKKVRMAQEAEEIHNLYCELRTAYLLLQEPKFAVEYEPYGKQYGRSADFAVTYRTHTAFHVEVTRLRLSHQEQLAEQEGAVGGKLQAAEPEADASPQPLEANCQPLTASRRQLDAVNDEPAESADFLRRYESRRLADVVCDKLGQLSPSTPNVLWMWMQSRLMQEIEIEQLLPALKRRIEQRDADLLARYGLRNPAEFFRNYQRLSVVLVQSLPAQAADKHPLVWNNNDARHPLPAKVKMILGSLIAADNSPEFMTGDLG
jgi:hypothetical protein